MFKYLRQLASESIVYGLTGTATRFITVFLVPLYTRALTPTDYGKMSLVRNTMALLAMCAALSLDSAAHRFYWDSDDTSARKSTLACWAWCHLAITFAATTVMIIFAKDVSVRLVGSESAAGALRFAAAALPLNVLGVVYMNRLRMERRAWAVTRYALTTSVVTVALTALLVLGFRKGIEGVFLAQLLVALGTAGFVTIQLRDVIHIRYFQLARLRSMLHYAVPLIPTAIAYWVMDVVDRYFLQAYTTTSQVGIYEIGNSIASVVALGTMAFQQAWIPFALSIHNVPGARSVYATTLVAYVWIGSMACAGATMFAPEALRLLTTQAYYGADSVVGLLAFSYLLMGAASIASLGPAVKKRTISLGVGVIMAAIANIVLNFWLVPWYGKDGAALATLISSVVAPIYLFYHSQKIYPIPFHFGKCLVIVVFAIALIRLAGYAAFDSIWLTAAVKMSLLSLFVPLLFALRIITVSDARSMTRRALDWTSQFRFANGVR